MILFNAVNLHDTSTTYLDSQHHPRMLVPPIKSKRSHGRGIWQRLFLSPILSIVLSTIRRLETSPMPPPSQISSQKTTMSLSNLFEPTYTYCFNTDSVSPKDRRDLRWLGTQMLPIIQRSGHHTSEPFPSFEPKVRPCPHCQHNSSTGHCTVPHPAITCNNTCSGRGSLMPN